MFLWKRSLVYLLVVVSVPKECNLLPTTNGFTLVHDRYRNGRLMSYSKEVDDSAVEREEILKQLVQAKEIVARTISIGAPAYNAGNITKCAKVYEDASNHLTPFLPSDLQTKLKDISSGMENMDDDSKAWALRGVFDEISGYQLPFCPMATNDSNIVFQPFNEATLPTMPREVMDNVMGGISEGCWIPETKTFRGTTSLANNGGFASIRWRFAAPQNWSHAKGIYFRGVKHEDQQHTFRVILKDATCERIRLANFKATFANPNGSVEPLFIPFSTFDQMEQMGNPLVGSPGFRPAASTEIGLMAIKPTVVGPFELQFSEWGLYAG